MSKAAMVSVLLAVATGCASASDTLSDEEALSTVALGIDTNGATLDLAYAKSRGIDFVGRYISPPKAGGTQLTLQEAQGYHQAGVRLVAIWEVDQKRAFEESSIAGERQLGAADAHAANTALAQAGGAGKPIYFTVDFDVTPNLWSTTLKDTNTGKQIRIGDLISAYFAGIDSVIGSGRAGAYGTYTTVHELFDQGRIQYGWQQTFGNHNNDPRDSRAQLRQYDIYPDQTGWGVSGAGALDLDRAVHANFGQWETSSSPTNGSGSGSAPSVVTTAFQANTSNLWTVGNTGNTDWQLGMMAATSPSLAALAGGGFEVAFQANTSDLWTVGSAGNQDWKLGMMPGTSPSITALVGGGFEVAFQANTGDLWTVGSAGNTDWKLGMMNGTSPSIVGLDSGGFEVAFQANTSDLWTVGHAGNKDWQLGMHTASSPSITALAGGKFQVAFEANTTNLWTVGGAGNRDWQLGMMAGTSPSITTLAGGGFEVAFQANTTNLWTVGDAGDKDWQLGMMPGSSPSIRALPGGGYRATFEANTTDLWSAGTDGVTDMKLGMMKGTSPSGS